MRKRLSIVGVLSLVMLLVPAQAAWAQPTNDDLADAVEVTEIPFADSVPEMDSATLEPDEPTETCAPFGNTVWYALTLDGEAAVTIDTAGSGFDTALAVWTGTGFDDAALVACNDDTLFGLEAQLTVMVEPGVTYLVQAGAFFEAPPGATLEIAFGEPARPTGKPAIFKSSFRGRSAAAFTGSFDGECFRSGDLFVNEGRSKNRQQPPFQFADLFVSLFEECFDPESGESTFVSWFAGASLTPDQYHIDRKLRSASVDASLVFFGESCTHSEPVENGEGFEFDVVCVPLGPEEADVAVEWTGQGPTFKSRFSDRFSSDGIRSRFTSRSTSRSASVAGGVSNDLVFLDLDGAEGFLSSDSSADMLVVRGVSGFFPF